MSAFLELRGVGKRYRTTGGAFGLRTGHVNAVREVSFAMRQGETMGLVGESGCGKSTLARLILGLEKPSAGEIAYKGKPLDEWDKKDLRKSMQMVFQDPFSSLNPRLSIGTTVGEGPAVHGLGSRAERKAKVLELLSLVGLDAEQAGRYPHEFSGGQRQRVAIARALALEPELMVCDEPVSALDVSIQAQVLSLLQDMQARFGLTYLFISHDLSVVNYLCDRVAVMYLGSLVELADKEALYSRPLHPYTKALLAAVPVPDPEAKAEAPPLAEANGSGPAAPVPGCPFAPRCPDATETCARAMPELIEAEPGHFVRCPSAHDPANKRIEP